MEQHPDKSTADTFQLVEAQRVVCVTLDALLKATPLDHPNRATLVQQWQAHTAVYKKIAGWLTKELKERIPSPETSSTPSVSLAIVDARPSALVPLSASRRLIDTILSECAPLRLGNSELRLAHPHQLLLSQVGAW